MIRNKIYSAKPVPTESDSFDTFRIYIVSSTVPQIIKGLKTRKNEDVSVWLIMALIARLSL